MAEKLCSICQSRPVLADKFDKCMACAEKLRNNLRDDFVGTLAPDQRAMFDLYNSVCEEYFQMAMY